MKGNNGNEDISYFSEEEYEEDREDLRVPVNNQDQERQTKNVQSHHHHYQAEVRETSVVQSANPEGIEVNRPSTSQGQMQRIEES